MNTAQYVDLEAKAKIYEIDRGMGNMLRALEWRDVRRFTDLDKERWEVIRYKTRQDLVYAISQKLQMMNDPVRVYGDYRTEGVVEDIMVMIYLLYPEEFVRLLKISKARKDIAENSRSKFMVKVTQLITLKAEENEARKNELI